MKLSFLLTAEPAARTEARTVVESIVADFFALLPRLLPSKQRAFLAQICAVDAVAMETARTGSSQSTLHNDEFATQVIHKKIAFALLHQIIYFPLNLVL